MRDRTVRIVTGWRHPRWLPLAVVAAGLVFPGPAAAVVTVGSLAVPTMLGANGYSIVQGATAANTQGYAIPSAGVVTSWSYQNDAGAGRSLKLRIYAAIDNTHFRIDGASPPLSVTPNAITTAYVRIPVPAGDLLGLRTISGSPNTAYSTSSSSDQIRGDTIPDQAVGQTDTYVGAGSNFRVDVLATVEPDADGDGFGDESQDRCPGVGGTENGCAPTQPPSPPPDTKPPGVTLAGVPSTLKRKALLKGIKLTITTDEPAALEVNEVARATKATIAARRPNLTLASARAPLGAGPRSLKLKANRKLVGKARRFTIQLQVQATDAAGNRVLVTRSVKVNR
jgi:hypothetical protein